MDLVADMLLEHIQADHVRNIQAARLQPRMRRRFGRLPMHKGAHLLFNLDRLLNRFVDYPHWLSRRAAEFDVFHVIDHSYAQLVHMLPAARTVVTCHDIDTFLSVVGAGQDRRSPLFRAMVNRTLSGLRRAARIVCVSRHTRDNLLRTGLLAEDRLLVIPNGVHPSCKPEPNSDADGVAAELIGPGHDTDILHVGSTVDRKRIDVLLEVFARVLAEYPQARLIRVGGDFTPAQRGIAERLGVFGRVVILPKIAADVLAAVYRRATLVLVPSDREGFALPVAEAQACGTPVVASDIDVLRETGGHPAIYCRRGDVAHWTASVINALRERTQDVQGWQARRADGILNSMRFRWNEHARQMASVYEELGTRR